MFERAEVIKVTVLCGCVKPSTLVGDNRNGIEAHFKTGGKAGATWIWQVEQVCLAQWPCLVDMRR